MTAVAVHVSRIVRFADPYKKCTTCRGWIDGVVDAPGRLVLVPCYHEAGAYLDICPSWGPVDGCRCDEFNARHPEDPIVHDRRARAEGDTRTY